MMLASGAPQAMFVASLPAGRELVEFGVAQQANQAWLSARLATLATQYSRGSSRHHPHNTQAPLASVVAWRAW